MAPVTSTAKDAVRFARNPSWANGAVLAVGILPSVGTLKGALKTGRSFSKVSFAQSTFHKNAEFSLKGQTLYSEMAGSRITTIDDMVSAIKSGKVDPKDVEIQVVVRDGTAHILNTRSSVALNRAGVKQKDRTFVDMTENKKANGRLTNQLSIENSKGGIDESRQQNPIQRKE